MRAVIIILWGVLGSCFGLAEIQSERVHTVQEGETLAGIASEYNTTASKLAVHNHIEQANLIIVGQAIRIPGDLISNSATAGAESSETAKAAAPFTVQKNDSLYLIAQDQGVDFKELAELNHLGPPYRIYEGQTLLLPVPVGDDPGETSSAQGPSESELAAEPEEVIVAKGQSLSLLASRHGVTVRQLADFNRIQAPYTIYPGQKILIPPEHHISDHPVRQTIRTKVLKNQTLSGIASKYGVPMSLIARYNNLREPDEIYEGQTLIIPGEDKEGERLWLPESTMSQLNLVRVTPAKWDYIVIHHTATHVGDPVSIDRDHRRRGMENGMAYHFLIGNGNRMKDGEIHVSRRWMDQLDGGHLKKQSLNKRSIGICLVGNFQQETPSQTQMENLYSLVRYLMNQSGVSIDNVKTHRGIHPRHTLCPGRHFPFEQLIEDLERE